MVCCQFFFFLNMVRRRIICHVRLSHPKTSSWRMSEWMYVHNAFFPVNHQCALTQKNVSNEKHFLAFLILLCLIIAQLTTFISVALFKRPFPPTAMCFGYAVIYKIELSNRGCDGGVVLKAFHSISNTGLFCLVKLKPACGPIGPIGNNSPESYNGCLGINL